MVRLAATACLIALSAGLAGPAGAASIAKTYSYFGIGGTTLSEIEAELGKRGPQINGAGKRHPGATRMEFTSRLGYGQGKGFCRVTEARVSVKANVILPRWQRRGGADDDTKLIWDTLSADIKRHEESHIVIARNHAQELERELKGLPRRKECAELQALAQAKTAEVLARHDEAQARFDRVESINFESRMLRLLNHRLGRTEGGRRG